MPRSGRALQSVEPQLSSVHARYGVRILRSFPRVGGLQVLELPGGMDVSWAANSYQKSGLVQYAQPDYEVHATDAPNDPQFTDGSLWGLNNLGQGGGVVRADIRAQDAWAIRHDAPQIVVAIIDTGVRYTHEDLAANIWVNPGEIPNNGIDDDGDGYIDDVHGINAITSGGDPMDDNGHGTHVAGTIGALGNNGLGVTGVAWKVQLMACKFLNSVGSGYDSDSIACFDYARTHGANIISCSFGGGGYSPAVRDAIQAAADAGVIVVVAAGNSSLDTDATPFYPAGYGLDNMVVVAASTRNDALAHFSNFGQGSVALAAPGQDIVSTWLSADNAYKTLSGTSMATPVVSGGFALLRAQFPTETMGQLFNRVYATVDRLPSLAGLCRSAGRLNLGAALASASSRPGNDDFDRRLPLVGLSCRTSGSNLEGTREADEPIHPANAGGKSVWWTWRAPMNGRVVFAGRAASFNVLLAAYQGTNLSQLVLQAASAAPGTNFASSSIEFEAHSGTDYAIAADGQDGASGRIFLELELAPRPPNDNFADRLPIQSPISTVTGSNALATKESGEPPGAEAAGGKSVWWSWTPTRSGSATVSTEGSDFDTVLAVYTGAQLSDLALVASNDDEPGKTTSRVEFEAAAGTPYQILVDGHDGATGRIVLNTLPTNDAFADALPLSGNNCASTGYSVLATTEPGEPDVFGQSATKSLWWTWTAPETVPVSVTTAGSSFDTVLAVYAGASLAELALVASNDNDPYGNFTSLVRFNAVVGTQYHIRVAGKDGASGIVQLNLGTSDYAITGLDPLAGFPGSGATAINADGIVAGYCIGPAPEYKQQACIWKRDGSVELICTNSDSSLAMDLNDRGQVVGYLRRPGIANAAFLWQNGVARELEGLPLSFNSAAEAIDNEGRVLGWSYIGTGYHAFMWLDGVTTDLGVVNDGRSTAYCLNSPDFIVGNCMNAEASVTWPVVWRKLVIEAIPVPASAREGTAFGVNRLGQVVGGYWDSVEDCPHAFWFENGTRTDLGSGDALFVNNLGQVTGWNRSNTGYLWRNGQRAKIEDLLPRDSGWEPWYPRRINDWGQIVGSASYAGNHGTNRAFVMTPLVPPTPRPIISTPVYHQRFESKSDIAISSWIAPRATNVTKVEFFAGDLSLGSVSAPPYDLIWTNVPAGDYTLRAVASTLTGATNVSQAVPIVVTEPADTDGDGLPDAWELANGTDPAKPDAAADPDGDGLTNWQEFAIGTSPTDPRSSLRLSLAKGGTQDVELRFQAMPGRTYLIEASDSITPPAWVTLQEIRAQPVARVERLLDQVSRDKTRFYRLTTLARP